MLSKMASKVKLFENVAILALNHVLLSPHVNKSHCKRTVTDFLVLLMLSPLVLLVYLLCLP